MKTPQNTGAHRLHPCRLGTMFNRVPGISRGVEWGHARTTRLRGVVMPRTQPATEG